MQLIQIIREINWWILNRNSFNNKSKFPKKSSNKIPTNNQQHQIETSRQHQILTSPEHAKMAIIKLSKNLNLWFLIIQTRLKEIVFRVNWSSLMSKWDSKESNFVWYFVMEEMAREGVMWVDSGMEMWVDSGMEGRIGARRKLRISTTATNMRVHSNKSQNKQNPQYTKPNNKTSPNPPNRTPATTSTPHYHITQQPYKTLIRTISFYKLNPGIL